MHDRENQSGTAAEDNHGTISLRIAGLTISLLPFDLAQGMRLDESAAQFVVSGGRCDAAFNVRWSDDASPTGGRLIFDSGGVWRLFSEGQRYRFEFVATHHAGPPYKSAVLKTDFSSGEIYLNREHFHGREPVDPLEYPLDELLIVGLLAQGRGAEIHGCGAVDADGQGYLMAGQSGAGKTTVARLLERHGGATILSDERVILRQEDGDFWIYGTPWPGEGGFMSPVRAPLRHIYFLRHGVENQRVVKSGAEAVALLFACSFPTFYCASGMDFTLEFMTRVCGAVPCSELYFLPDFRAINLILRGSGDS